MFIKVQTEFGWKASIEVRVCSLKVYGLKRLRLSITDLNSQGVPHSAVVTFKAHCHRETCKLSYVL